MKYNEFHRLIRRNGWVAVRQRGSHVIYEKNGKRMVVPDHGAREMVEELRLTLAKRMGIES